MTFRTGPKVEHERFDDLVEALAAVEARLTVLGGEARRQSRSVLGREYAPVQQVAARAEISGPRRLRAGVDLRGDGSLEAWTGRVAKRPVSPQPGEDVYSALRRALTA